MLSAGELDIAVRAGRHDDRRPRARAPQSDHTRGCRCSGPRRAPDGWPIDCQRHRPPVRGARARCEPCRSRPSARRRLRSTAAGPGATDSRRHDARHPARRGAATVSSTRWKCAVTGPSATVYVDADHRARSCARSTASTRRPTIGQGTGVLGARKKMSTNQTSSTYQAVDMLRPAEAFTLDFRGTVSRLNLFLQTGALFNSDIATDSDNTWDDGPDRRRARVSGLGLRLLLQAVRPPRHGRSQHRSRQHRPSARAIAGGPAAARHRRVRSSTTRSTAATACSSTATATAASSTISRAPSTSSRTSGRTASPISARSSIYQDESGALNEAFSDIMGAAMEFYYQPVGSGPDRADWLIAEDVVLVAPGYLRSLSNPTPAASPTTTASGASSARRPTTAASTST